MNKPYKITNLAFYFVVIVISVLVIGFPPINILSYDIFGYYMYLPLAFKYHDISIHHVETINNILSTYHSSETLYQAVHWDNGNWVMRYPIGLSVFFTPFYFIGDMIAKLTGYEADGFSKPYQLSILYGCLIYTIIGLHFIKKILIIFFNDLTSAITLFCIALGTNYFFHVTIHGTGAMSHNILFTIYAIIIYLTIQWHKTYSKKHIILLGLFVGFSALCRPSEIISVLIPLCYGVANWTTLKSKIQVILQHKIQIIYFTLMVVLVGSIQFMYWKYVSGKFIINPYAAGNPGEGLELFHPHILEVLFSFRKGWFIYTPMMLFIITGFWHMYKTNKVLFTPVFIYFIINFYIVSCWSCWWYGACFGVRSLVPCYAALSIPMGYFISFVLNNRLKYMYLSFMLLFIALNLFQSWQLKVGIMDDSNISRAYYFSTFLQTTPVTADQKKLLLKGKFSSGIETFTKEDSSTHYLAYARLLDFEKKNEHINPLFLCDTIKHTGKYSYVTDPLNPDCPPIEMMYKDISKKSYTWIKASVWLYSKYPADSINAIFSIELKHRGLTFKYKGYALDNSNFKANQWNKLEYYYLTPDDLRSKKDEVKTFFSNKSKYPVYVDDLLLESYEPIIDKSVF